MLLVSSFASLLLSARWLTASGFSPLWGSFTFPLASYAAALISLGGHWAEAGMVVLLLAAALIPMIGVRVVKMWATGALAAKTNAAEA